ncbi:MAG: hypothetical protein IBJ15_14810 [Alphaproteobacteria bacterium]|nr:hypothetical protein [Alphaproteobacteria bacterium]
MEFFKFYILVLREALRHSLDLTQTILFIALFFTGLVTYGNPNVKTLLEPIDLNDWKFIALLFSTVVAIRLVLAPYWLWKSERTRILTEPTTAIDYHFRVHSMTNLINIEKKIVQVGFVLHNSFHVPVRYEVDEMNVTVNCVGNDKPEFKNMGGIVAPHTSTTFYYDHVHLDAWISPGAPGTADITYRYGVAGRSLARRAKFVCEMTFESDRLDYKTIEDTEVPC